MRKNGLLPVVLALGLLALPAAAEDAARLRVGIVSDVHVSNNGDKMYFVRALEFFRLQNVDAVMIAGDLTNSALPREWRIVADAWLEVFPDDKAPDGHTVEKLFVLGNHDSGLKDRDKAWREYFRDAYAPIWIKTVKGYVFAGAQWGATKDLAAFYKAHESAFAGDRPFFYVQHAHPRGTCLGDWAWGNEPCATAVLTNCPNGIAISGHSHYTLTDERSIWQGAFTSVNAGSLNHEAHEYNLRDNARVNRDGYTVVQPERLTPLVGIANSKAGLVMTVTDGEVRFARYSFHKEKPLSMGPDWVVPVGRAAPRPYAFATRAAGRSAPAFTPDATVTCKPCEVTPDKNGPSVSCLRVGFPHAESVGGCRVFDYEVTASLVEDGVVLPIKTKRVLAPAYHLPESVARVGGCCMFALSDFPTKAHLRFSVRPVECFGKMGEAISTDVTFGREIRCTVEPVDGGVK